MTAPSGSEIAHSQDGHAPSVSGAPVAVRGFAVALALVLVGYMFMGRGFAHLGLGPIFVGDWVLLFGLAVAALVIVRERARLHLSVTTGLLVAFMVLGALRTIPYLGTDGIAALRDGVLWGYGIFALLVLLLFGHRGWLEAGARAYGWLVPIFAIWLPISWLIFQAESTSFDPRTPGSNLALVFFKAGDMAVHAAAAIAFLVLAPGLVSILRAWLARFVVSLPLTWTIYLTGSTSRGAILAAASGLGVAAVASPRPLRWAPVLAAAIVVVGGFTLAGNLAVVPVPSPTPLATAAYPSPTPGASPASPAPGQTSLPTASPPAATPAPPPATPPPGRAISPGQWLENIGSIFGSSSASGLEGTKDFRLAWWKDIVSYTVFGPYFWTGKGFGINLADADGFQPTADHSLRAPHNSHMSVLARMGVPGLVLWVLFQGAFAITLLRAILAVRRDDKLLAAVGSWVLVVWAAMMVVTSFDPYLEGPQGGIWFWVVIGVGLVVTKLAGSRSTA